MTVQKDHTGNAMGAGTKNTDELRDMLAERKAAHGDFRDQFYCAQMLKDTIERFRSNCDDHKLDPVSQEALDMILHKISRIATGNPNHKDHWRDIAGYAELIAGMLE